MESARRPGVLAHCHVVFVVCMSRFSFLCNSEEMTFCDIEVHLPLCCPFREFV